MNEENMHADDPSDESATADPQADAALDALLLRFGNDYHRPPDIVPREEMWHAIRSNEAPRHFIGRHPSWSVLAAAALLLGVGITIGVEAHSRISSSGSPMAGAPAQVAVTPPTSVPGTVVDRNADGAASAPTRSAAPGQSLTAPRNTEPGNIYAGNTVPAVPEGSARNTAYTLATVRHFAAVEALLTSYRTSPHDANADAQMADWARALLSQTRLLIDSPAAKDPVRNKLLQDLELVLVQMTQLSPANTPVDREMIDGAVQHADVITRLRTAVPAGAATSL